MKLVLDVTPEFILDALAGRYGVDIACQVDAAYPTHVCGRCGTEFRWQQDRADRKFVRTTGVQFCGEKCARAMAQRALRARRKAVAS